MKRYKDATWRRPLWRCLGNDWLHKPDMRYDPSQMLVWWNHAIQCEQRHNEGRLRIWMNGLNLKGYLIYQYRSRTPRLDEACAYIRNPSSSWTMSSFQGNSPVTIHIPSHLDPSASQNPITHTDIRIERPDHKFNSYPRYVFFLSFRHC